MPNKTIYVRDEKLWARARKLAGDDRLSSVVHELLTAWVRNKEAEMAGQMTEMELEVGGKAHAAEHDDEVADRIAFNGRLVADSDGLSVAQMPRVRVYQTHTGKLIVYRRWTGTPGGDALGATYHGYADYDALTRDPSALATESVPSFEEWKEGTYVNDEADLAKAMRAQLMRALGKPVVVRLD